MKRFLQNSYSWLATLLLAVAFAISGNVDAQTELTFGRNDADYQVLTFTKDGISVTGYGYNCGFAAWGDYPSLNMYVDAEAGPRTITVSVPTGTIEKIEMTTTSENGTNTNFKDVTVNTGSFSTSGNTSAVWEGNASEVVFSPGENTNVFVNKIIVYASDVEGGGDEGGSTGADAKAVELPFAFSSSSAGTIDGVGFYMSSANWVDSTELYGEGGPSASWGTVTLNCAAANIIKVELTCRTNSWSGVGSNDAAAKTVCETENLEGYFTYSGNVATWVGAAHSLTFSSTDDIDVYKIVVYTLADNGTVKECTIGVDHYADNCKPGKCEYLTKYITFYMQGMTSTTNWTGKDNCPEGVTLTNEVGQQFPVAQFNYWKDSDQLGIQLQDEIRTPGVYTLHIPEGLIPFTDGKWNKEINVEWTIVAPDLRPTKDVVFDFTDGTYTNDGTTSYTQDGVGLVINENRYNTTAQGFRIGTDGWLTFTAPENTSIKSIQLLQESSYGVNPDFSANVGEVSTIEKTLFWNGDNTSVTLTDNYGTCYFTKAIVTLAVEEAQPEPNEDELAYPEWKKLFETYGAVEDIAYNYGYQVPTEDIVGKKPAAVAAPIVELYNNVGGLAVNAPYDMCVSILAESWNTTIHENYAYALGLLAAYEAAEVVSDVTVDPAEEAYAAWKILVTNNMKAVKDEWGEYPEADVPGKKPADVVKAVMEYYTNTSWLFNSFSGFGDDWAAAKAYYANYGTTIEANYAEAQQIWMAYVNAELVPEVVEPTTKDKYTIKLDGTDYYFTTNEVKDNSVTTYSISATPEYFYIEPSAGGYTIKSADTDKWVGYDVISSWDFSNDEKVWTIGSLEGEPTFILKNGSKGFGVDNRYEGAGVYTDKSGQYWVVEKFVEGGEVDPVDPVDPNVDLNEFAGEWLFQGEGAYLNYEDWDGSLTPKQFYTVNMTVDGNRLLATGLIGYVYDEPNAFVGTYDAQAGTLTLNAPYFNCYVVDGNYEYYTSFNPLVLNVTKNEAGQIVLSNTTGWQFAYEDWYYEQFTCGYTGVTMTKDGELPELEPNPELLKFAGNYLFKGVNANSNDPQYTTKEYYDCEISVYGDDLHLTGFIGEVEGKMPYLVGKYDAENNRIKFSHPGADGGFIKAENGVSYYMDYFYVNVEGEEGEYVFDHSNSFIFYAYTNGEYTKCSYDSFKFIENGDVPEGWNHNILFPETANSIDDLLTYTLDFEEAVSVEAASADVLGVVFEASGNPYAIVLANGVFDVFGNVKFQGSKATVQFVKIADLNAQLQTSAKSAAARIGGFLQTPGAASVVFAGKSFKVDGELVYDMIQKDYEIAGEGAPTAIESIVTTANDSIYDLSGRRVKTAQSGLYIKNGVKVYMK